MKLTLLARPTLLVLAVGTSLALAPPAHGDQTIERPGSILMFPKVCRDGVRDTSIKIANTGNLTNHVRCFYLDGRDCSETDFDLSLTRQQPTQWRVSAGRQVNPGDGIGGQQSGLDPGLIPPVPLGFCGALICAEVGPDGMPVAQNKLKGEANLIGVNSGLGVTEYNAIAVTGGTDVGDNDRNNDLELDDSEYAACPAAHMINFTPAFSGDQVIDALGNGGRCIANPAVPCNNSSQCPPQDTCAPSATFDVTTATVLPCDLDFNSGNAPTVKLNLVTTDELEVSLSRSVQFQCWGNFVLDDPLPYQHGTVRIAAPPGSTPVIMVAESFHMDTAGNTGVAASSVHKENGGETAIIRLQDHP